MDEETLGDLWREFCAFMVPNFRWPDFLWYSEHTETAFEDFRMCQQAADNGVDYAQKRMVAFLAWRMQR